MGEDRASRIGQVQAERDPNRFGAGSDQRLTRADNQAHFGLPEHRPA